MDGFVETFFGGLNPHYTLGSFRGPSTTPHGAGAVALHDGGGSATGLWVNVGYGVSATHVGVTNPDWAFDQGIAAVKILQARIPPPWGEPGWPIITVEVGRDQGADAEPGDAASLVFSRAEDGSIQAALTLSPPNPLWLPVRVGGSSDTWVGGLWLSHTCTATEVIAELWDHDPSFGGIPLASQRGPRGAGLAGSKPSGLELEDQASDIFPVVPLLVSQWSYRPITPPLPTVKVTGGQRGQISFG